MSSATLTSGRRHAAPYARLWGARRGIAAAALTFAAAVAFWTTPSYSSFDTIWSLVWGQEILRGELPSFDAYRAPTQHPLWVAIGVVLAPLGDLGNRLFVGICVAGWVALVLGAFRLASVTMGEVAGWCSAALIASRLDYGFLAMRGFLDVPFLAMMAWAAALEAQKPRRGGVVWVLLILGGLLRPEAWLLGGLYFLWRATDSDWPGRIRDALYTGAAPLTWWATDWIVTGNPLYSLTYTTWQAEALKHTIAPEELPARVVSNMASLTKLPVLLLGVAGIVLAARVIRPKRRAAILAFLSVFGIATFVSISLVGFSAVYRYLVLSAFAVTLFAGFALGGWQLLARGRVRTAWIVGAILAALAGTAWTVTHFDRSRIDWLLYSRERVHDDLVAILRDPAVIEARRCGTVTVPNHKLVPDTRYLLEAKRDEVVPRGGRADFGRDLKGVHLFVSGGPAILFHAGYGPYGQRLDSALFQVRWAGFERVASHGYLVAYASCA